MPKRIKCILDADAKLVIAVEALKFYANKENWNPSDAYHTFATISDCDLKYYPQLQTSDLIGGKTAIEALEKISQ